MRPYLIDSHSHLNFNAYKTDGSDVIRRSLEQKIWMITVGSQFETSARALVIANNYANGVYAAIGLHPIHLHESYVDEEEATFKTKAEKFDEKKYQTLINSDTKKKIVAVGEIGLDYFHLGDIEVSKYGNNKTMDEYKKVQQAQFIVQLNFARKNNLPVILHCRGSRENPLDAYQDILKVISNISASPPGRQNSISGVLHCFGANLEIAQKFIKSGFYLGFTGIITFGKSAEPLRAVVRNIPMEKILVETDAPYLAPEPHRGERNEPSYVSYVAEKIAEIKKITPAKVAEITVRNSRELFKI
jgi:TatD DNase family protein